MADSDAGDTLHSYFRPEASPPPSKRAKTEDSKGLSDLGIDASMVLDISEDESDNESDNESLVARSVRRSTNSSPATALPPTASATSVASTTAGPDWMPSPSNADKTCESHVRFDAMKELALRRAMKAQKRTAGQGHATATPMPNHILIESDDEDAPPAPASLTGGAATQAAWAQAAAAAAAPAAPPPVVQPLLPAAVEEDEADTSMVVGLYDPPLAALAPGHPSALAFSATLEYARQRTLTPDDTDGLFAPGLLERQVRSSAQLHPVALAMQAFEKGRAFLIGDGTGVGKGRESMGVIASHWHKTGARRALVVSVGSLSSDVERDFKDCKIRKLFPGTCFVDASAALPARGNMPLQAVVFTTYSQLRSKGFQPYAKLLRARGGNGAGTLVLDEVHRGTGDRKTKTYKEVEQLIETCPDSPLLCMSATFASHIEGLRLLAPRLGLVGPGLIFKCFDELKNALGKHKETGLELLTAQLSHEGLFLARCISYHGTRAEHLSCTMSAEHEKLYETCAKIYADLWDTGLYESKFPKGYYVGSKVRFFKSLLLLAKLPDVVARVRSELAKGQQVVVTVLGTSEAALKRADPDEVEVSGGVSALRDEVMGTIEYGRTKCGAGAKDIMLLNSIAARVDQLPLSRYGALDQFKHQLREHGVAELTGRSNELKWDEGRKGWFPQKMANDIVAARRLFQNGSCKVALVSGAASTGISLHDTGDSSGESCPRTMILFELPWSAAAALQLLGRVHRSAQLSQPLFITTAITTAEQRFSAAVAQRLRQLGALTTGDQRDDGGSRIALDGEVLLTAAGNRAATVVGGLYGQEMKGGRQLLNFALGLAPKNSEELITQFFDRTAAEHRRDVAMGRVPPPRQMLKQDNHKTQLVDTFRRPGIELQTWKLDRRLTWEDACAKKAELEANGLCITGFATSIAYEFNGLCLCHYRDNITAVRCFFLDGRVASVLPEKLVPCNQGIETRWRNTHTHTSHLSVTLAMVPCLESLSHQSKPPKIYRIEYADGQRAMGVYVPDHVARILRRPPAPSTTAAETP